MSYNNLKYVIVPAGELGSIDFSKVIQKGQDDIRYSEDGEFLIVQYEGNKPFCLYGKTVYTHQQILAILNDVNGIWFNSDNLNV